MLLCTVQKPVKLQIGLHRALEPEDGLKPDYGEDPIGEGSHSTFEVEPGLDTGPRPIPEIRGYEVLGILGQGGMGVVYRAWQTELKRPVAIKMVHAGAQASPSVLARFRVEAEAVARLKHPNLVQIYDVGDHAGAPFIVLELVDGARLGHRLAGTPQPAGWAADLVETLARAIHSAHLVGVVHRDLTPSNILIAQDGVPKITDFGLAKLVTGGGPSRTQTGDLLGTPSYMAPEQAGGLCCEIGPATDVYSLGAILYETLTGRPPFKAEQPIETLRQVVGDDPVSPSRLRPRLPIDLETICLKCLRKEPAQRYASGLALADDLRRFREGRPILARRTTAVERLGRWCRRNPGLAAANITAAALTAILALGAIIAALTFRQQRDQIDLDRLKLETADRGARENLIEAYVAQAEARRFSRRMGQRFESLLALDRAARIARDLKLPPERFEPLRDAAIACLALADITPTGRVIHPPSGTGMFCFDARMSRYALRLRSGTILVKSTDDERELARLQARGDHDIFVFALSPDGRYLATTHVPGFALTVWDLDRNTKVVNDPGPVEGSSARFSRDSRRLALAHADGIVIYDLESDASKRIPCTRSPVEDLAFGPDGLQLAITNRESNAPSCRILDIESGRLVRTIPLRGSSSVAWSADGATLATACIDSNIDLWDVATGIRKAQLVGASNAGLSASFHPANTLLASNGWEGRLRLWDTVLGLPVLSFVGTNAVRADFSDDGRIAVAQEGRLTIYQVETAREYTTFAHVSEASMHYYLPSIRHDGRLLAVGTNHGVVLWDLATGLKLGVLPGGNSWHVLFDARGDLIASGNIGMQRWPVKLDVDRGQFRIGPPHPLPFSKTLGGIAEDRLGQTLALANYSRVELRTAGRATLFGPLDDCRSVALSPDGRWLLTGSHRAGAQVWRVDDATRVAELPVEYGTGVAFSPDGKCFMTKTAPCKLWSVGTWKLSREIDGEGLCFTPDGRMLATVDASKVIRFCESTSGRTIARLESPDACDAGWATFSPDGSRLVLTTNSVPAVHVWDLRVIRGRLASLGLDWSAPAFAGTDPVDPTAPPLPALEVDLGLFAGHLQHYNEPAETLRAKYTAAIEKDPDGADAYHHRGHALSTLQRLSEAIADFDRAIRLRPADPHLRVSRAKIFQFRKQFDRAIADFEAALARNADPLLVIRNLSQCYNERARALAIAPRSSGDAEEAFRLAGRAIELAPDEPGFLKTLGLAQYRTGQYANAIATLEPSIAASRWNADAFDLLFLAMAHHRQGRRERAIDYLERGTRWIAEQRALSDEEIKALTEFRTEANAFLADPANAPPTESKSSGTVR